MEAQTAYTQRDSITGDTEGWAYDGTRHVLVATYRGPALAEREAAAITASWPRGATAHDVARMANA